MTNVTISISILQTFQSWEATSHLRPPMAFLSHNSSDTPGLAPLMNVLFWGRCDFPISFSGRDISRNVWNRLSGSSMVGTGILPNNMRSPSPECYTTFCMMTYTVTPSIDRTLHQFWTVTDLGLITEFDVLPICARFPWNICNGCGMPTEDAYFSGHLVLSNFGICMCSNVETNRSWTCLVSGFFEFRTSIGTSLLLHTTVNNNWYDFNNFHITDFPFLGSDIPSSLVYCVFNLSLYDMPELVSHINLLFRGPGDFPVRYSNKDVSWTREI